MKPRRRWFQYSLRSFLILLTALAVWLGVVVNRAREQREAVKAIEAVGGRVVYTGGFYIPAWIRRCLGKDVFENVVWVHFAGLYNHDCTDSELKELIPMLQQLPNLRHLSLPHLASKDTAHKVKRSLPQCKVRVYHIPEI